MELYNGKTAERINAPATPIITAPIILFFLPTLLAIPKIIIPINPADKDLWFFNMGIESMTELIFGITIGLMRLAERTAIMAVSPTTSKTFFDEDRNAVPLKPIMKILSF